MGLFKWVAGGMAVAGGGAWLGFKVSPAPFAVPPDPGRDLGPVDLADGLPEPVRRYYEAVALLPRVESAYASGRGEYLLVQAGPLKLWAPMRWRLYLQPGRQFRWEGELTWYGQPFIGGSEEIVNGEARFVLGWQTQTGEAIHKTEHTLLWLHTVMLCPSALLTLPEVSWTAIDHVAARLSFPSANTHAPDDRWTFTLYFDPASATLTRLTTHRFKETIGAFLPYQVRFGERRPLGGTSLPGSLVSSWVDTPVAKLLVEQVRYNVPLPFALLDEAQREGT